MGLSIMQFNTASNKWCNVGRQTRVCQISTHVAPPKKWHVWTKKTNTTGTPRGEPWHRVVADDIWLPSLRSKLRQQRQTALPLGSQGAGTDAGAVNDAIDLEAIFLDENMDKLDLSEQRVATPKSWYHNDHSAWCWYVLVLICVDITCMTLPTWWCWSSSSSS